MNKDIRQKIREQILDKSIYEEKRYKNWRKKVFERDRFKCQFPGCKQVGGSLQAHHIKGKYKYPELIYSLGNGITLCYDCHNRLHKHKEEKKYQKVFQNSARVNKPRPRMIVKPKVLKKLTKANKLLKNRSTYVKAFRSKRRSQRYRR